MKVSLFIPVSAHRTVRRSHYVGNGLRLPHVGPSFPFFLNIRHRLSNCWGSLRIVATHYCPGLSTFGPKRKYVPTSSAFRAKGCIVIQRRFHVQAIMFSGFPPVRTVSAIQQQKRVSYGGGRISQKSLTEPYRGVSRHLLPWGEFRAKSRHIVFPDAKLRT